MSASNQEIAKILLETKAVKLNVSQPFTFASGIKSPIYCDNRHLLGFPQARKIIAETFSVLKEVQSAEVIAGTATAGIAWAAFISEILSKPMAYVRSSAKGYGVGKTVEGASVNGKKVAVIEDLISTGGSSKKVLDNILAEGGNVIAIAAIFTYEFPESKTIFGHYPLLTLSDFPTLITEAKNSGYLSEEQYSIALQWNKAPHTWDALSTKNK